MRCKILVDSSIAPSAVCAKEIPSLAFLIATPIPRTWEFRRLEICRPAASSLAELIRLPVDRRSMEVARALEDLFRLRWAPIAVTLVLTVIAISKLSVEVSGVPGFALLLSLSARLLATLVLFPPSLALFPKSVNYLPYP